MAIATVVQRGSTVYVYNEQGRQVYAKPVGSGPNNGLQGYTSQTFTVRIGHTIYTYNESGRQISAVAAR